MERRLEIARIENGEDLALRDVIAGLDVDRERRLGQRRLHRDVLKRHDDPAQDVGRRYPTGRGGNDGHTHVHDGGRSRGLAAREKNGAGDGGEDGPADRDFPKTHALGL